MSDNADRESDRVADVTRPADRPERVVSPLDALARLDEIVAERSDALTLTNKQLAVLVGCDPRTVRRWRRARRSSWPWNRSTAKTMLHYALPTHAGTTGLHIATGLEQVPYWHHLAVAVGAGLLGVLISWVASDDA